MGNSHSQRKRQGTLLHVSTGDGGRRRDESVAEVKDVWCGGILRFEGPRSRAASLRGLCTNVGVGVRAKDGGLATTTSSHAKTKSQLHNRPSSKKGISRVTDGPAAYLKMLSQPKSKKDPTSDGRGVAEDLQILTVRTSSTSSSTSEGTPEYRRHLSMRSASLPSVFSRCTTTAGAFSDTDCSSISGSATSRNPSLSSEDSCCGSDRTEGGQFTNGSLSRNRRSHRGSTANSSPDHSGDSLCSEEAELRLAEDDTLPSIEKVSPSYQDQRPSSLSGRISRCSHRNSEAVRFHIAPLQVSTNHALRCFAASVQLRCPLSKLRVESIENWVQTIEASLVHCRWQEQPFLCVANVVVLYSIFQVAVKLERVRSLCELRGVVITCLYLAYSYGGHEISYPLRPFLYTNDRTLFWERCVRLTMRSSGTLLKLNSDEDAYLEALENLLEYGR